MSRATRPLLATSRPEAPFLLHASGRISGATFVARVLALAARLPPGRFVVNLCDDRHEFLLTFAATLVAGRTSLLPPSRAFGPVRELRATYGDGFVLAGAGCEYDGPDTVRAADLIGATAAAAEAGPTAIPEIAADHLAAIVFSSGSTGTPTAHRKTWGALIDTGTELAERFGIAGAGTDSIVGTVPPQHMYGLETTILLPLATGALVHAGRPFFPADVVHALAAVPGRRWLMTTPLHLRALAEDTTERPPLDGIVSATMPLAPELARSVETRWGVPVAEIYGCTEAGSLATRRVTADAAWVPIGDITIARDANGPFVQGGHVAEPVPLTDAIEIDAPRRFRLLGRAANLVKVGGKRTSIEALNAALASVPGVVDGAFHQPDLPDGEARLVAFVVARDVTARQIVEALRDRIDPVFLPRPLHLVAALPRNDLGKLVRADLERLAATLGRAS